MVDGLRLQPVYSVSQRNTIGYEVLSRVNGAKNCEAYFSGLCCSELFLLLLEQLNALKKINDSKRYFLNLPVRLLCQEKKMKQLLSLWQDNFIIELQDPENFSSLDRQMQYSLQRNLTLLQRSGVSIWLDDLMPEYLRFLSSFMFSFDGIKIDKHAFWHLTDKPEILQEFINCCLLLSGQVLIEGVENYSHYTLAAESGATHLQGFYWRESLISLNNKV